jgi:hypothetical protein
MNESDKSSVAAIQRQLIRNNCRLRSARSGLCMGQSLAQARSQAQCGTCGAVGKSKPPMANACGTNSQK